MWMIKIIHGIPLASPVPQPADGLIFTTRNAPGGVCDISDKSHRLRVVGDSRRIGVLRYRKIVLNKRRVTKLRNRTPVILISSQTYDSGVGPVVGIKRQAPYGSLLVLFSLCSGTALRVVKQVGLWGACSPGGRLLIRCCCRVISRPKWIIAHPPCLPRRAVRS